MTFAQAMTFPFNQEKHRVTMGEYNIRMAKECFKNQKWQEGYMNLASGVGRAPKNVEGRQMLAEFQLSAMGRPDLAIETLGAGLVYAQNDIRYIRFYLRLLLDQSEDSKLVRVGEALLQSPELTNKDVKDYIAMALSTVYAMHGSYSKSKEYLEKYNLANTLPGILRLSKNEWEQGKRTEAIKVISDNFDKVPQKGSLYMLLMNYYRILGNLDKARQYSMLYSLENPFSIEQRLEYMRLLRASGDVKTAEENLYNMYENNKNDPRALLQLANYAADIPDLPLMRKIYDTALKNNFSPAPFCLLLLETMLTAKDFKSAVAMSESILKEKPIWIKRYDDVFACLRAIAYYATGNSNMADILISDVLKRSTCSPKVLIATARRLDDLGADNFSHKLLENAVDRFPKHQLALTRLVHSEIKMGNSTNLDKHIFRLLQMRRPPRELIIEARKNLASDSFIFTPDREKIMAEINMLINNTSLDFTEDSGAGEERMLDMGSSSNLDF